MVNGYNALLKRAKNVLNLIRQGASPLSRMRILGFVCLRIIIYPLKFVNIKSYSKIFHKICKKSLKNTKVKIRNRIFLITNVYDLNILSPTYEKEILYYMSFKGNIFIDIGAHLGKYSLFLTDYFQNIIAIEAAPNIFSYLVRNIELNKLRDKIIPLNYAILHEDNVSVVLKLAGDNTGSNTLVDINSDSRFKNIEYSQTVKVRGITLDTLIIEKLKICPKDIDLIKIDVEGAEHMVLKGAKRILTEGSPRIIIEIWPTPSTKARECKNMLSELGYSIKKITPINYIAQKYKLT